MNNIDLVKLYIQRDKNLSDDSNYICKERIYKLLKFSKGNDHIANIVKMYWNNCNDWDTLEKFYKNLSHEEMVLLGY
jgi:hypothetical protein